MGASSSVIYDHQLSGGSSNIFISEDLLSHAHIFSSEVNARICYVDYIKSGMWMENLKPYERLPMSSSVMDFATKKTWEAAGYYVGEDIVGI